jgi:hypothetical protein
MFSADFLRGGKSNQNCPITYAHLIELHTSCVKALTDKAAKISSQNVNIDTGLYGNYVKRQVVFPAGLAHLKAAQFEEPAVQDKDKCVLPLLHTFQQKARAGNKSPGNYLAFGSCSFGPAHIGAYEKANTSFKTNMLMTGPSSIPELRALIEYDISNFHLRKLEWKPKEAAHLADKAGRADGADDDAPRPLQPLQLLQTLNFFQLFWSIEEICSNWKQFTVVRNFSY